MIMASCRPGHVAIANALTEGAGMYITVIPSNKIDINYYAA